MLQVFSDGPMGAFENMQRDREIFHCHCKFPVLRLYSFSSLSATLGVFTPREGLIDEKACREKEVQIALRPTGGGLLFHEHDLSFCVYVPGNDLSPKDLCVSINGAILRALQPFLGEKCGSLGPAYSERRFCYSTVTPFDLVWKNVKIGGCAGRRSKHGALQQGSIFLKKPDWDTIETLLSHPDDIRQMRETVASVSELAISDVSEEVLKDLIIQNLRGAL